MADFDVIVVGASVAGSTCAGLLAREGFKTLLVDKATFPREKICGEGLMPAGARILEDLGVLSRIRRRGRPFSRIRFYLPGHDSLQLDFTEIDPEAQGWVITRHALDAELVDFSAGQPGIQFWQGFQVRGVEVNEAQVQVTGLDDGSARGITARLLIGADGIHSRFHNDFQLRKKKPPLLRFALRALYDGFEEQEGMVEVHCCPGGEAYVAPLGNGAARITLLLGGPVEPAKGPEDLYVRNLRQFPALLERLNGEKPAGEVEGTGPISSQISRCHAERAMLIGDAAGAPDPITGQGMSVALKDAVLAARVAVRQLREDRLSERDLRRYSTMREAHFRPSFELAQFFLFALRHPFLARRAARLIQRNRRLREKVLATAVHSPAIGWLTRMEKMRLLAGI